MAVECSLERGLVAVSITAAQGPSPRGRPVPIDIPVAALPFKTTTMGTSASKMQLQQQHLLILHHARKCPHGEGGNDTTPCPVTPHCAATKRLWQHIAQCTHKKCSHCYSARRLLTHYRDCKDVNCMTCGPVREVVRRSREEKKLELQQQMQLKTDTFSTSMTTAPSAGHSKTTIGEWVSLRRDHLMTIDGAAGRNNMMQSPTSESNPTRPPIIPIPLRRGNSFSSMSSLSHCSSILSSTRSSVPSSRSGGSRNSGVYCSECRRLGGMQAKRVCSSGIRCKNNPGIAHFCKPHKIQEEEE